MEMIMQEMSRMSTTKLVLIALIMLMAIPLLASSPHMVVSTFISLWTLIKGRPFILVTLNFIIIFLLIASTSFSINLHHLFQIFQSKAKPLERWASHHVASVFGEEDTWLLGLFEATKAASTSGASWKPEEEVEVEVEVEVKEIQHESYDDVEIIKDVHVVDEEVVNNNNNVVVGEVEGDEHDDTLDATWQAIMEKKSKGSGPQLKKSDTWSAGEGGGGGRKKGRLGGRLAEFKWRRTYSEEDRDGGGSSGGGGGGGWSRVEMVLTYHDELKKKADAFIAKFANDMRLQRLESDQRLLDMINRGG